MPLLPLLLVAVVEFAVVEQVVQLRVVVAAAAAAAAAAMSVAVRKHRGAGSRTGTAVGTDNPDNLEQAV